MCIYIYIYMCGSCLNKCISIALGPPKQKFLAPPLPRDSNSVDKNITRLFIIFYMHLISFSFFFFRPPPTHKGRILPLVGNLSHPPISLFLRMICECNMLLEHCSRGSFSHKCNMANWCSEFNGKEMVAFLGLPPTFTRDSTIPPSNCIL